jgi:hypothetical protein
VQCARVGWRLCAALARVKVRAGGRGGVDRLLCLCFCARGGAGVAVSGAVQQRAHRTRLPARAIAAAVIACRSAKCPGRRPACALHCAPGIAPIAGPLYRSHILLLFLLPHKSAPALFARPPGAPSAPSDASCAAAGRLICRCASTVLPCQRPPTPASSPLTAASRPLCRRLHHRAGGPPSAQPLAARPVKAAPKRLASSF